MKEKNFSEYDLIQAISGSDAQGLGKCQISIQPQRCNSAGVIVNTDFEYLTDKPVVQMFKQQGGYVLVDFVFESINDVDLQRMYGYFQDFFVSTNSINEESNEFPLLVVSIVPNALNGEYWTMGINPIHYALAPDNITGMPNVLRMVFVEDEDKEALPNFFFMQSDKNVLDEMLDEDASEEEEEIDSETNADEDGVGTLN